MPHLIPCSGPARYLLALALALLFIVPSPVAFADVAGTVNAVRREGCGRNKGVRAPLREQRALSAAARRLSRGDSLEDALMRANYRAKQSASLRLRGNLNDKSIANSLRAQFCQQVTEPAFRDVGVFKNGDELWMIVAMPFVTPSPRDAKEVSRRILEITNQTRARGQSCGGKSYPPVPPLTLNDTLERAALAHSRDLASHSTLSHTGSDGSTPADRATRAGYRWRVVGENVAAGPMSADEVTNGWIASPNHCVNIMDPRFTEMAAAFTVDPKSKSVIYWAQMFGLPR
jgi:uncharacterized protein YkwD